VQILRYESGASRLATSRLYDIAAALDVPVSFFFEDARPEKGGNADAIKLGTTEAGRLISHYRMIDDRTVWKSVRELIWH
jgi:transcriptional regulator with XRE-family HTH domain